MADEPKLRSELVTLFANNTAGDISAQDLRDFLISTLLRTAPVTYTASTPAIDDDDFIVELDGTSNTVTAALPNPAAGYYPFFIIKCINNDNACSLAPGDLNLENTTDDYIFVTENDVVALYWTGSQYRIAWEYFTA